MNSNDIVIKFEKENNASGHMTVINRLENAISLWLKEDR